MADQSSGVALHDAAAASAADAHINSVCNRFAESLASSSTPNDSEKNMVFEADDKGNASQCGDSASSISSLCNESMGDYSLSDSDENNSDSDSSGLSEAPPPPPAFAARMNRSRPRIQTETQLQLKQTTNSQQHSSFGRHHHQQAHQQNQRQQTLKPANEQTHQQRISFGRRTQNRQQEQHTPDNRNANSRTIHARSTIGKSPSIQPSRYLRALRNRGQHQPLSPPAYAHPITPGASSTIEVESVGSRASATDYLDAYIQKFEDSHGSASVGLRDSRLCKAHANAAKAWPSSPSVHTAQQPAVKSLEWDVEQTNISSKQNRVALLESNASMDWVDVSTPLRSVLREYKAGLQRLLHNKDTPFKLPITPVHMRIPASVGESAYAHRSEGSDAEGSASPVYSIASSHADALGVSADASLSPFTPRSSNNAIQVNHRRKSEGGRVNGFQCERERVFSVSDDVSSETYKYGHEIELTHTSNAISTPTPTGSARLARISPRRQQQHEEEEEEYRSSMPSAMRLYAAASRDAQLRSGVGLPVITNSTLLSSPTSTSSSAAISATARSPSYRLPIPILSFKSHPDDVFEPSIMQHYSTQTSTSAQLNYLSYREGSTQTEGPMLLTLTHARTQTRARPKQSTVGTQERVEMMSDSVQSAGLRGVSVGLQTEEATSQAVYEHTADLESATLAEKDTRSETEGFGNGGVGKSISVRTISAGIREDITRTRSSSKLNASAEVQQLQLQERDQQKQQQQHHQQQQQQRPKSDYSSTSTAGATSDDGGAVLSNEEIKQLKSDKALKAVLAAVAIAEADIEAEVTQVVAAAVDILLKQRMRREQESREARDPKPQLESATADNNKNNTNNNQNISAIDNISINESISSLPPSSLVSGGSNAAEGTTNNNNNTVNNKNNNKNSNSKNNNNNNSNNNDTNICKPASMDAESAGSITTPPISAPKNKNKGGDGNSNCSDDVIAHSSTRESHSNHVDVSAPSSAMDIGTKVGCFATAQTDVSLNTKRPTDVMREHTTPGNINSPRTRAARKRDINTDHLSTSLVHQNHTQLVNQCVDNCHVDVINQDETRRYSAKLSSRPNPSVEAAEANAQNRNLSKTKTKATDVIGSHQRWKESKLQLYDLQTQAPVVGRDGRLSVDDLLSSSPLSTTETTNISVTYANAEAQTCAVDAPQGHRDAVTTAQQHLRQQHSNDGGANTELIDQQQRAPRRFDESDDNYALATGHNSSISSDSLIDAHVNIHRPLRSIIQRHNGYNAFNEVERSGQTDLQQSGTVERGNEQYQEDLPEVPLLQQRRRNDTDLREGDSAMYPDNIIMPTRENVHEFGYYHKEQQQPEGRYQARRPSMESGVTAPSFGAATFDRQQQNKEFQQQQQHRNHFLLKDERYEGVARVQKGQDPMRHSSTNNNITNNNSINNNSIHNNHTNNHTNNNDDIGAHMDSIPNAHPSAGDDDGTTKSTTRLAQNALVIKGIDSDQTGIETRSFAGAPAQFESSGRSSARDFVVRVGGSEWELKEWEEQFAHALKISYSHLERLRDATAQVAVAVGGSNESVNASDDIIEEITTSTSNVSSPDRTEVDIMVPTLAPPQQKQKKSKKNSKLSVNAVDKSVASRRRSTVRREFGNSSIDMINTAVGRATAATQPSRKHSKHTLAKRTNGTNASNNTTKKVIRKPSILRSRGDIKRKSSKESRVVVKRQVDAGKSNGSWGIDASEVEPRRRRVNPTVSGTRIKRRNEKESSVNRNSGRESDNDFDQFWASASLHAGLPKELWGSPCASPDA